MIKWKETKIGKLWEYLYIKRYFAGGKEKKAEVEKFSRAECRSSWISALIDHGRGFNYFKYYYY